MLSHIDLVDVLYDMAPKEFTNKLQLVQNAACRVILPCGKRDSIAKMHSDLDFLHLQNRRDMHLQYSNHKNIHAVGSVSKLLS